MTCSALTRSKSPHEARAAVRLVLPLLLVSLAACGDPAADGASLGESDRLVGSWRIEDPVAPVQADFSADKTYRVAQEFGDTPFVQEGTWSLQPEHLLVQEHGSPGAMMRNSETIFVGERDLVIGGILVRDGEGEGVVGTWVTVRALELESASGGFVLSSRVTRTVEFDATGAGTVSSVTERENTATGEAEAPTTSQDTVRWSDSGDGVNFVLTGAFDDTYTLVGDQLVPLGKAYKRQ